MNDAYSRTILEDSPVGYWRLNERRYTDPVVDESCNGRHGRFSVDKPTLSESGAIAFPENKAMAFAPEAYIEIPHSPDFSIQTSGRGLTVEVWMCPLTLNFPGEGQSKYIHWLGKGERKKSSHDDDKMEWGFRFYADDDPERPNRISAYAWNPQGGLGAGAYYQGCLVKKNEWLHLVACYEHYECSCTNRPGVQLFVNGEFVNGPPSPGTLYFNEGEWSVMPRSRTAPLRIGTRSATANSFLTGKIDEVAIYPRVLTAERIKTHFEVGKTGHTHGSPKTSR